MTEYRVTWMIDVEAESPALAAREALEIQRDPESDALYFRVKDRQSAVDIDLKFREVTDWQHDVAAGNTILGYKDWLQHQWEDKN